VQTIIYATVHLGVSFDRNVLWRICAHSRYWSTVHRSTY